MTRHPLFWLPNLLTVARCLSSVFVAWIILAISRHEASMAPAMILSSELAATHALASMQYRQFWGGIGLVVFVLAAFSDWLDGSLARRWNAQSRFGRLLDPIADKLAIGLPLLAIAAASEWALPVALPVFVIIFRDVLITVLRFVGLGAGAMKVSIAAKIKTAYEMLVVAFFLFALATLSPATALSGALLTSWLFALWGAAILSAWTGIAYVIRLFGRPQPQSIAGE